MCVSERETVKDCGMPRLVEEKKKKRKLGSCATLHKLSKMRWEFLNFFMCVAFSFKKNSHCHMLKCATWDNSLGRQKCDDIFSYMQTPTKWRNAFRIKLSTFCTNNNKTVGKRLALVFIKYRRRHIMYVSYSLISNQIIESLRIKVARQAKSATLSDYSVAFLNFFLWFCFILVGFFLNFILSDSIACERKFPMPFLQLEERI